MTKIIKYICFIISLYFIAVLPAVTIAGNFSRSHATPEILSEITVHAAAQTPDGVMWFASELGLFRYDGNTAKKIILPSFRPTSNNLRAIEVTPEGKLWLGYLGSGIALYDPVSGQFNRIFADVKKPEIPAINRVWSLLLDPGKSLWIGTYTNGLFHYNLKTKKITKIHISLAENKNSALRVNVIYKPKKKSGLLIGTNNGLYKLANNKHDQSIRVNFLSPENTNNYSVWDIAESKNGKIWILTNKYLSALKNNTLVKKFPKKMQKMILSLINYLP